LNVWLSRSRAARKTPEDIIAIVKQIGAAVVRGSFEASGKVLLFSFTFHRFFIKYPLARQITRG